MASMRGMTRMTAAARVQAPMAMASRRAMHAATTSEPMTYVKSKHHLLVLGGNGFVGSNILQRAVQKGIEVRSLNLSGKPLWEDVPWIDRVDWIEGDVFNPSDLATAMKDVTGVISTIGAFGSNEFMEKVCGDSTILAAEAAQKAGAERFVFISNSRVGSYVPSWAPGYGYYNGKERGEGAVQAQFPTTGVSLRPGFIYGWRRGKGKYSVPLQALGAPLAGIARSLGPVSAVISRVPILGSEMQSAVPVGAVAKAAVLSAIGPVPSSTLDTNSILELADSFHNTF